MRVQPKKKSGFKSIGNPSNARVVGVRRDVQSPESVHSISVSDGHQGTDIQTHIDGLSHSKAVFDIDSIDTHVSTSMSVSSATMEIDVDVQPFLVGQPLIVRYRDGSLRLAKIIERKVSRVTTPIPGESKMSASIQSDIVLDDTKYYIHYHDFNRRMDEWIDNSRIAVFPSKALEYHQQLKVSQTPADQVNSQSIQESTTDTLELLSSNTLHKRIRFSSENIEYGVTSNDDSSVNNTEATNELTTVAELEHDEHEGLDEASVLEHEEVTKVKNFLFVQLGRHIMECWYFSPLPKEFHVNPPVECIYFCEYSFRFFKTKNELARYQAHPSLAKHPPGNEIYRDASLSMFEIDGAVEKVYCQNLCYFAKLFLDHKTLYWDCDPFLFYVLCTFDERGYHPVGYFSKEKYSDMGYNLACILTFPSSQRKGYGKFLINFSYELSKKEDKVGSPEKPLSDLGAVSYRSYWASILLRILRSNLGQPMSILELSRMTSFLSDDIILTLNNLGLLQQIHGETIIYGTIEILDKLIEKYPMSGHSVDPDRLHWTPLYVLDPRKDRWSLKSKKEIASNPSQPTLTSANNSQLDLTSLSN